MNVANVLESVINIVILISLFRSFSLLSLLFTVLLSLSLFVIWKNVSGTALVQSIQKIEKNRREPPRNIIYHDNYLFELYLLRADAIWYIKLMACPNTAHICLKHFPLLPGLCITTYKSIFHWFKKKKDLLDLKWQEKEMFKWFVCSHFLWMVTEFWRADERIYKRKKKSFAARQQQFFDSIGQNKLKRIVADALSILSRFLKNRIGILFWFQFIDHKLI